MLKIHKLQSKSKLLYLGITSICIVSGLLALGALTYTPELSHAETVTYPEPKPDLSSITYMQDITQEICANTKEADTAGNYQYQLIDKRDNKTYWVAKLRDGNCWMTQNLALDLAGITLTSADSNVSGSWTSTTGVSVIWSDRSSDIMKYYNPGNYYYTTPTRRYGCESSSGLVGCTSHGWKLNATNADYGIADINVSPNLYQHYHAGNYYSWYAVTAGTARNTGRNGTASGSICPNGWKLPLGRDGYNDTNGSFYHLLSEYGLQEKISNTQNGYDIRTAPLYFVYSGEVSNIFGKGGTLTSAGGAGTYYSSMSDYEMTGGVDLRFHDSVFPSASISSSGAGYSARCFAVGGEAAEVANNVDIAINNTISLDVANEVEFQKSETNPSTANLDVKVASNQPHNVSISSSDPVFRSNTTSVTIPSKNGLLNTNENAWGIKLNSASSYSQITSTPTTFYTATGAEVKTIPFTVGVSTAPDLPAGEYSTNITVTATQN